MEQGATLTAPDASSILITTPLSGNNISRNYSTLLIDGTVNGGTSSAIAVTAPRANYYLTRAQITVSQTGRIAGPVGIDIQSSPYSYYIRPTVILDNSGVIAGTGGNYALRTGDNGDGGFESITNRATGTIGAIHGYVGTLINDGLIDGGDLAAYSDSPLQYPSYYASVKITNGGTIRSRASGGTILLNAPYNNNNNRVENSGVIANDGTGPAVSHVSYLELVNQQGGSITSSGTAISGNGYLVLNNEGTITGVGDAVANGSQLIFTNRGTINGTVRGGDGGSMIDNVGGIINGNLLLGAGDDLLIGDTANLASPLDTITGIVDAGGGVDTLRFTFMEDQVLDRAIALPGTIERLSLRAGNGSTLTFSDSFASTLGLVLDGGDDGTTNPDNRFVINGRIDATGPALSSDNSNPSGFQVINNGAITASLATPDAFAVTLSAFATVDNKGTITGRDGGGVASIIFGEIDNSGTIEADGTAVVSSWIVNNSGTIRSIQGVGLDISESHPYTPSTNSGTIEGAMAGARVFNGVLHNTGIISSGGSGVQMSANGVFENKAGGVVSGGLNAISTFAGPYPYSGRARVVNAGTINGNVDIGGLFIAAPGGIVNGDINLSGDGSIFATYVNNSGPGEFSGLTGHITSSGRQTLRYLIDADTSTTPQLAGIFTALGYDLANDATLTLASRAPLTFQIGVSGQGSVDLSADMTGVVTSSPSPASFDNSFLINLRQGSVRKDADGDPLGNAIKLTSSGHISMTDNISAASGYISGAVLVGTGNSFTNAGRMTVDSAAPAIYAVAAIQALGGTVINDGLIELSNVAGIRSSYDEGTIINHGSIEQLTGGGRAIGILGGKSIDNTGVIRTGSEAILAQSSSVAIRNSGTIRSDGAAAITTNQYYGSAKIINEQGGLIAGGTGQPAIRFSSGSIVMNAGSIVGDVVLGADPYSGPSAYINRGGTLAGNLSLGSGDSIFVSLDDQTGVSGTIDAGSGADMFIHGYSASRSIDVDAGSTVPAGFEKEGYGAYGADTTVTLSAASAHIGALLLVGDGSFVNEAALRTSATGPERFAVNLGTTLDAANAYGVGSNLFFTNKGSLGGGIGGTARGFANEGEIFQTDRSIPAVSLKAANTGPFTFINSGQITASPSSFAAAVDIEPAGTDQPDRLDFDNSGTIAGRIDIGSTARHFSFSNSGDVLDNGSGGVSLSVGYESYSSNFPGGEADEATISNSGTIATGLGGYFLANNLTLVNSGAIGDPSRTQAIGVSQYGPSNYDPLLGQSNPVDPEGFTLINSGAITGETDLGIQARAIDIRNSGTMASADRDADAVLSIEANSVGAQNVAIVNDGTITANVSGLSALLLGKVIPTPEEPEVAADTVVTLTNRGTIQADQGAYYTPAIPSSAPEYGYPDLPETLHGAVAVGIDATSSGASSVMITNAAGGTISAAGTTGTVSADETDLYPYMLPDGYQVPDTYKTLGSLAIGVIADSVSIDNAGTIRGLAGGIVGPDARVQLTQDKYLPIDNYLAGAIQTFGSTDTVINRAGGIIIGSIDLGDKDDSVVNLGRIDGDIFLGSGNDSMVQAIGRTLVGTVDGGADTDSLVIDLTGGGILNNALLDRFVHFESVTLSGTGAVTTDGPLAVPTLVLRDAAMTLAPGQVLQTAGPIAVTFAGGSNSLVNLGTINGGLDLTQGSNMLTNGGLITGPVTFGDGDDRLLVESGAVFGGAVNGGGGIDTVQADFAGTDAAPTELDLSGFEAFEHLQVAAGTGALSGTATFSAISVDGGRLIGRVGSTITGNVLVAQGATFGSAGTVNGDIMVNGTLSPGASPGTMRINGNVALNAGSTTLLELTPALSDVILINGALTINDGAKLTMTGNRPLTPGFYTLINASGGITGSFGTNVTRDSAVMGILTYSPNSIDLVGLFQLRNAASAQVAATKDYLNKLLLDETATPGVLAAFPALLEADGYASPAALSTLSPEPYASAAQMGIENGLAIAGALRSVRLAGLGDEGGMFVFGQAYGNWRNFGADERGVSGADIDNHGYLGGFGYGNSTVGAALFIGRSDSGQHLRRIGASNSADGLFFGGRLHYAAGGLSAGASLIFDRAKADTQRNPMTGGMARSHYGLHGTTADAWLGYGFAVGGEWQIGPRVGLSHVSVKRDAVSESGGGAFALDVAKKSYGATFLTGDIKIEAPGMTSLRPWATAGVRWRAGGDAIRASASFAGTGTTYSVAGAERKKTMPHVGAGFDIAISSSVSLFVSGDAEFGKGNGERHVNGGVNFKF